MSKPPLPLIYNTGSTNIMSGGSRKEKMDTSFIINNGNIRFFEDSYVIDPSKFKTNRSFLQKKYSGEATISDYFDDFKSRN